MYSVIKCEIVTAKIIYDVIFLILNIKNNKY